MGYTTETIYTATCDRCGEVETWHGAELETWGHIHIEQLPRAWVPASPLFAVFGPPVLTLLCPACIMALRAWLAAKP